MSQFQVGNKFWLNRSKHGRDTLFASAELLWEAACEYFDWCIENPWYKSEAIKSGEMAGKIIKIPTQRPFTLIGLCLYIGCSEAYFRMFDVKDKPDFFTVITQVEEIIRNNKYEGAVVGAYNANIISRELGFADNINHGGQSNNPIMVNSEVSKISLLDRLILKYGIDSEQIQKYESQYGKPTAD